MIDTLPNPRLTQVCRLHAVLGCALGLGDSGQRHRRVVPMIGGQCTGPETTSTLWTTAPPHR